MSFSTVTGVFVSYITIALKFASVYQRGEEKKISFINVNLIAILESKYPRQSVIPICQPARARTAVRITTQLVKASDRDAK